MKLRGPSRGVWHDLYVMLDIFSRYVVGWRVEETETGEPSSRPPDHVPARIYRSSMLCRPARPSSRTRSFSAPVLPDTWRS